MSKRALEPPAAVNNVYVHSTVHINNNHYHAAPVATADDHTSTPSVATAVPVATAAAAVAPAPPADDTGYDSDGWPCAALGSRVAWRGGRSAPVAVDDDESESSEDESDEEYYGDDDVESVDARRARLRQAWTDTKGAIMGTPATWGINPRTKRPRGRQPDRSDAAMQATVRDYEAHAHEIDAAFGGRITEWIPERKCFRTTLHNIPGLKGAEIIRSHSWADALRAHAAATACADAHHSMVTIQDTKRQLVAANAPKRAENLAKHGDNCALERRELVRLRDVVEGALRVLICPDGCLFDALFRTEAMSKGQWLGGQHKSTHKLGRYKKGYECWHFAEVKGYADGIVVCTVATEPDLVWAVRGKVLDEGKSRHMRVTKDKVTGKPLPLKADGKTLPMPLEDVARVLEAECAKVVARDATALRTFTVEEAEAVGLGKSLDVERAGVLAWMRCLHGGAVAWAEMPEEMQRDARNLRLMRDGTVIAYPDGQNTKTDLEVINPDGTKTTHQFKTAKPPPGTFGLWVNLQTNGGNDEDGTRIMTNTYRRGDNDVYTAVLPDTVAKHARAGRVDVWTIPEAELATRGLLRTAEDPVAKVDSFMVYRNDGKGNPSKHGWTRKYHRAFVKGADGAWVEEK